MTQEKKREENLRKREEERKQRELEQKKKWEQDRRRKQQGVPQLRQGAQHAKQEGDERRPGFNVQRVKVNFGDQEPPAKKPAEKSRAQLIEEERQRAEEKLQRRLEKKRLAQLNANKETTTVATLAMEDKSSSPPLAAGAVSQGKDFGDYTNLHGEILTIRVTKICKRLGIAIDGGANTKQKAVIIREISVSQLHIKSAMVVIYIDYNITSVLGV